MPANKYSDSLLMDALRGSLSNAESFGRGFAVAPVGLLGDIEGLLRKGVNFSFGRGGVNVGETPVLPTTEGLLSSIPRMTAPRMETAGIEQIGSAANPRGPINLGRAVASLPSDVKRAGMEYLQASAQPRQIFVGPNSKTWNKQAADTAVQMEKAGASPRDIWEQTGTFRGAEGKLRQEISDKSAQWQPTKWDQPYKEAPEIDVANVGSALSHPELLKAYPELGQANIVLNPSIDALGSWNAANPSIGLHTPYMQLNETLNPYAELDWLKRMQDPNSIDYWKNQARYAIKEGFSPRQAIKDMRQHISETEQKVQQMNQGVITGSPSTALHELQHGVQHIEDFARGGNPQSVMTKIQQQNPETYTNLINQQKSLGDIYDDAYKRLAGEAEARLTQTRKNLTPEQRLQFFPFEQKSYENPFGLDVKPNDLIVLGGLLGR